MCRPLIKSSEPYRGHCLQVIIRYVVFGAGTIVLIPVKRRDILANIIVEHIEILHIAYMLGEFTVMYDA